MKSFYSLLLAVLITFSYGFADGPSNTSTANVILTFQLDDGVEYQKDLSAVFAADFQEKIIDIAFFHRGKKTWPSSYDFVHAPKKADAEFLYSLSAERLIKRLNAMKISAGDYLILDYIQLEDGDKKMKLDPITIVIAEK